MILKDLLPGIKKFAQPGFEVDIYVQIKRLACTMTAPLSEINVLSAHAVGVKCEGLLVDGCIYKANPK